MPEGVELASNGLDIVMNSKSEWNSCRIPRVMIEVEEDSEDGMICNTEMGGRERKVGGMTIRKGGKR